MGNLIACGLDTHAGAITAAPACRTALCLSLLKLMVTSIGNRSRDAAMAKAVSSSSKPTEPKATKGSVSQCCAPLVKSSSSSESTVLRLTRNKARPSVVSA